MALLVDVTSHINEKKLKLQGKNKLSPGLVNDIKAFHMQLRMLIFLLEIEDLCEFPHLIEQSECAGDHGSLKKHTDQNKLLQVSFESRFHDFSKEKDCILAIVNPFSLSEKINNEDAKKYTNGNY